MRDEYIKQLVAAIQRIPQTPEKIHNLRENALLWGATEEEFEEALKRVTPAQENHKVIEKLEGEKRFLQKVITVDLALHSVAIVILGIFALFLFKTFHTNTPPQQIPEQKAAVRTSSPLLPQVYAKSIEVNAQKVFSYPAKPLTLAISGKPQKEIYGYFPYWMIENQEAISLDTLTTLSYFGLTVDGKGSIITRMKDGSVEKGWESWTSSKLQNLITRAKQRNIKLELTIKSFNNADIEALVSSDEAQKTFINNTIQLIQAKAFDGVNLDFEYSGTANEETMYHFSRLVKNLRTEMRKQIPHATLTLSTYVTEASTPRLVDIERVASDIDSFVIMGYDFHTPAGAPGPIAPLEGSLSLTGLVQSYIDKVGEEKLVLALPHYGYDWQEGTTDRSSHKILPYIMALEESKKHQVQWDGVAQSPWYTYQDKETQSTRVVYFENIRSLGLKYDYINKKNLRGVGMWAMGYEGTSTEIELLLQEKFMQ